MPASTVSPGNQFWLRTRRFHSREGSTPALSPARSMPVGAPKPKAASSADKRLMPICTASW